MSFSTHIKQKFSVSLSNLLEKLTDRFVHQHLSLIKFLIDMKFFPPFNQATNSVKKNLNFAILIKYSIGFGVYIVILSFIFLYYIVRLLDIYRKMLWQHLFSFFRSRIA